MNGVAQKSILIALGIVVVSGVIGATLSHADATQILGFCSLIAVTLLGLYQQIVSAQKLDVVAGKAVEVKTTLEAVTVKQDDRLAVLVKVADATHALVNSNMAVQLQLTAIAHRRIADEHPQDVVAVEAAELSDKMLKEHLAKQSIVDAKDAPSKDQNS